jgi:hypothetical protein
VAEIVSDHAEADSTLDSVVAFVVAASEAVTSFQDAVTPFANRSSVSARCRTMGVESRESL